MIRASVIIILILCCSGTMAQAPSLDGDALGMVTGPEAGTQIRFGRDIARIAQTSGLRVLVKESAGSLDNIRRMASAENAAFGIVYADALEYLRQSDDQRARHHAARLRMIFPLYPAEVHLLARGEINTLADLKGRRVVLGEMGSGTWLTSTNILHLTGVKPASRENMPPQAALEALVSGTVDAMFFVVGKPVGIFKTIGDLRLDRSPAIANSAASIHFVPINIQDLRPESTRYGYAVASIGKADYPWMSDEVRTISIKAVLMTFDFSGRGSQYHVRRCQQLATLGTAIRSSFSELQRTAGKENGSHVKWTAVALDDPQIRWPQDTCSRPRTEVVVPNSQLQPTTPRPPPVGELTPGDRQRVRAIVEAGKK